MQGRIETVLNEKDINIIKAHEKEQLENYKEEHDIEDMTAKELLEDNTNLYNLLKNSSDDDIIFSTESIYNIDFYDIVEDCEELLNIVIKRLEDYNNDDLLNAYNELK